MEILNNNIQREKRKNRLYEHPWLSLVALWVDFGEYESPIRPLITEENQIIFFESVFIGKTLQLKTNPNGMPTMKWTGEEGTYNFVATNEQE